MLKPERACSNSPEASHGCDPAAGDDRPVKKQLRDGQLNETELLVLIAYILRCYRLGAALSHRESVLPAGSHDKSES
jgi:hypothetical protein